MAWNVKDAEYSRTLSTQPQTGDGHQMFLSPDGLKLYVVSSAVDNKIYEYTLSEAWNITTASYVQSKQFDLPYGIWISPDGTNLYFHDYHFYQFKQYAMSTPWDISTASHVRFFSLAYGASCFFNSDGTKLFIGDSANDKVHEYALSTGWDISTASHVQDFSVAGETGKLYGLFFHPNGTKMYVTGGTGYSNVIQYALSTPWDISTAIHTQTKGVGQCGGLSFKPDGKRMYVSSAPDNEVREYDILASDYYVKTDGNDALDGESEENAWLTIDHAQDNIGLNNNVNIAAGTYDETEGFTFAPPAGSKWLGAGAALTKLFTGSGYGQAYIPADVEIHDCQLGDDPGGPGSGMPVELNGDGFVMERCSNRCTLLDVEGVTIHDLRFEDITGGVGYFSIFTHVEDSDFIGIVHDGAAIFYITGDNNTFNNIQFLQGECHITCPTGSMQDCIFKKLGLSCGSGFSVDDLEVGTDGLTINSGVQTITTCKSIGKATVQAAATLLLSWYLKKFYEPSNESWTAIDAAGQTVLTIAGGSSNITFTERPLAITTDADISVLIDTWSVTDYQNKAWKVSATGSRAITFQLGDMLASRKYHLLVDGEAVSKAKSNASGVIVFPEYSGMFSERTFTTELVPPLLTHDEIRTAAISTLQADSDINAATKTWLRYLINTGQITYPAVYVGTIRQPFDGECGSEVQHTSLANPMEITVGVLSNTHEEAATALGELYEMIFDAFKDTPTLGLTNFNIHSIDNITTKPIPKCGRSIIRAELTLIATWVRSND